MDVQPVKEKQTPERRSPRSKMRVRILAVLTGVYIAFLLAFAIAIPLWWAPLPALSLVGVVAWRWNYFLAPIFGFVAGFLLWTVEMALLPSTALLRIVNAVAGIEGLAPTLVWFLGAIIFGVVAACAAAAFGGARQFFKVIVSWGKRKGSADPSTT